MSGADVLSSRDDGTDDGTDHEAGPGGLPWVRVRLRTAKGAALATFALVLVTAFLAAAMPRSVDRFEDAALRHTVARAKTQDRGITLSDSYDVVNDPQAAALAPSSLDRVETEFRKLVAPPVRLAGSGIYGARTGQEADVPNPELPRLSVHDPAAFLVAQAGIPAHTRVIAGRMPRPNPAHEASLSVEAAVTEKTAQVMHLKVGQVVQVVGTGQSAMRVRVCGILAPRDAKADFWHEDPDLLGPVVNVPITPPGEEPKPYWQFTLLIDRTSTVSFPLLGTGASMYWYHPLDTSTLNAHNVPAVQRELSSFNSGPLSAHLQAATGSTTIHEVGGLDSILDDFSKDRAAASPMLLVAAVGVGTTAFAVLLMAGGLAAERRRAEFALLRSRGGSLRGIGRRLAGETLAAAVPGGAVGVALALVLLPTQRWALPVALGAIVTLVAVLALPLRAVLAVRRPRPGGREDLATARPSRRRLVAELTVTVLVVGAVAALRQRGTGGGGGADPFLAASPVLVAVAAALVLLRVYPLPLRLLARPAARLTGAVTHLGLARAGRSPATGQLPLLAMLVALTVASFGGSVLAGVDHGRDRAATATVGADARMDSQVYLAQQLPAQVRKVKGIGQIVTARVEPNSADEVFSVPYSVIIADPAAYDRLTRAIGLPAFPLKVFGDPAARRGGALPAVLSPKLAAQLGHGHTVRISTALGIATIRSEAVVPTTPATPGQQFLIISAAQLAAQHPDAAKFSQYTDITTLLAMAAPGQRIDGKALTRVAAHSTTTVSVLLRSQQRAALADSPMQHGTRRIYLAAVAAGAAYSALALLLSLLQAAPQRTALLARLRTMGMTRRQSRRLVLLEMLPQALLGSLGGVLVGLSVIPLLGPGVDLRALTFGTGPRNLAPVDFGLGLHADPWSLALPSAGLLILACVVLLIQVWLSTRRRESTELRAGDRV